MANYNKSSYNDKSIAVSKHENLSLKVINAYKAWPGATYEEIGFRLRLQTELVESILESYKRREAGR